MSANPSAQPQVASSPPQRTPAALFVNTHSRRGARLCRCARTLLTEAGVTLGLAMTVADPALLPGLVADAVAAGYDHIIVGGGDGSLSAVLPAVVGRPVTLGVLPLGTSNSLARALGIPRRLAGAVATIAGGRVVVVDAGRANGRYFLNTLSIGLANAITREAPPVLKRSLRLLAYGLVAPRALLWHRAFHARLTADERTVAVVTHQLVVVNGTHIGVGGVNLSAGSGAAVDDHRLIVLTFAGQSRWQLLWRSLKLASGRYAADPETQYFVTGALTVVTDPPRPVHVDGEPAGRTPVTVTQVPRGLRVFAPPDFVAHPAHQHPTRRRVRTALTHLPPAPR